MKFITVSLIACVVLVLFGIMLMLEKIYFELSRITDRIDYVYEELQELNITQKRLANLKENKMKNKMK